MSMEDYGIDAAEQSSQEERAKRTEHRLCQILAEELVDLR